MTEIQERTTIKRDINGLEYTLIDLLPKQQNEATRGVYLLMENITEKLREYDLNGHELSIRHWNNGEYALFSSNINIPLYLLH